MNLFRALLPFLAYAILLGCLTAAPLDQVHTTASASSAVCALVLEETPTHRLSGKTGWAGLGDPSAPQIGWLVGYLERDRKVHFFATNIDIETAEDAAARLSITKAILRDLGLLSD